MCEHRFGKCYTIFSTGVESISWIKAQDECHKTGRFLASFDNRDEMMFLMLSVKYFDYELYSVRGGIPDVMQYMHIGRLTIISLKFLAFLYK